jgi:hypothetical protein
MTQKIYTAHNEIPKILVDYFESLAKQRIVDIDLFYINDFIAMMEERVEESYTNEESFQEAS